MKVKDLIKGQIYALPCPVNGYILKPFIFDKVKSHSFSGTLAGYYFIGVESPDLIVPAMPLFDNLGNFVDYGILNARLLTPLELELL